MPKTKTQRKRPGPAKVNDAAPIVLKMPADLREHIAAAAKADGVSVSAWIRLACHERALRAAWQRSPEQSADPPPAKTARRDRS